MNQHNVMWIEESTVYGQFLVPSVLEASTCTVHMLNGTVKFATSDLLSGYR